MVTKEISLVIKREDEIYERNLKVEKGFCKAFILLQAVAVDSVIYVALDNVKINMEVVVEAALKKAY